ncbi:chloride anion exchanger-like protein [Labeo rohita]|uniref:Chloride anion exchanger-like protein n=1 Tax=Labeo rohita TaxID=84645 RepID=A0A498MX57_LABRO|nr:chloride anion exchanger-like protein [Labeo rohita]
MLRPLTQRYSVTRPLYSEDAFEDEHAKVCRKHKGLLDHVIQYFTCTSKRAKNATVSLLPIIGWMKIYSIKDWLLNDIVSGISTGLVSVLQGLAFSLLASISTWYGLYAAFFPVIMYFLLGTSRHISVGSFPVLSLMVGAAVTRLVPDEGPPANITAFEGLTKEEQRILVSASISFLVGLFQLGMGLLQVGFIVKYLSDTLISGFTTAAAIHILVSQLKFILGLTVPGFSGPLAIIYTLESVFTQITSTNIHDLVTSIVVMVAVLGVKEINERFKSKLPVPIPIEVIMTVIACGVSYAFDFSEKHGVDVVGKIPNTFESPIAPSLQVFQMTAMDAFPIAIVGFAVAFAVAKVYAVKHDYNIDGNQELIAFGASNIFGGAFKSLAASTALSRSAVQESTGGKTQIYEPEGVKIFRIPSPIFFANIDFFRDKLKDAVGFNPLRILRKRNKAVKKIRKLIKTGVLTLTSNGLQAVCSTPFEDSEDESNMEDLDKPTDYSDLPIQVNWNAELPANIQVPPVNIHSLVLDFSAVSFLDISALKGLKAALKEFLRIDVDVYIVGCDPYIIEKLRNCAFFDDEIKTSIFFLTIHDAMLFIHESHPTKTVSEKPFGKHYVVVRPLFSEDSFAEQYERTNKSHKTLRHHLKDYCTCNANRAKNAALSLLPIIGWIKNYNIKQWLLGDIVSGISTGLVAVLQGLAFSLLASLPPGYGLYTAFFPAIIYFFLGTSRHLSVGAFPILSLMVGAVVTRLVPDEGPAVNITAFEGLSIEQQRVLVASSVTFVMGAFQLIMGLLQVGFIVMYLSETLVSGFTTAAAVQILVSQLRFVLGLDFPGINGPLAIIYTLIAVFSRITNTNVADLVTSIVIMALVLIVKEINDRFKSKLPVPIPIEVIMTVIACGVSYAFNFEERFDVVVVGEMVNGYETPIAPNLEVVKESAVEAFPMAIVGFAVAFSVAKVYSVKHDYTIDGNQELLAFGVSNMFGASFRSFAASTALSRTAIQESTGGKTQIAGVLSAIMVLIVIVAVGFLLEPLPRSVLGALVIVNLKGMLMQFRELPYLWKNDRSDFVTWVVTFLASLFLGLDLGLAVGLGAELFTVVCRAQFPRCSILANITGTDIYRDRKDYSSIYEPDGVKIFKIPSPIFFANIDFFKDKLVQAVGFSPLKVLKKRNKALQKIRKMLRNGELEISDRGLKVRQPSIDSSEDDNSTTDLDQPIDFSGLPIQVNWKTELPANISVPPVTIHSLVLDFSAVSFLDISALKGLKATLKEFIRIEVDVYIVSCDVYIMEKLHRCSFFDDEIKTSVFYPTLHDAMLHILEMHPDGGQLEKDMNINFEVIQRDSISL